MSARPVLPAPAPAAAPPAPGESRRAIHQWARWRTVPFLRAPWATVPALRGVAAMAAAGAVIVGSAGLASAHVRVFADDPVAGGYSKLTFRVPTESETAKTTKVEVTLPTDHPLTYVGTRPLAGWTAKVTEGKLPEAVDVGGATITEAPLTVTWTAAPGVGPGPGEFEEFELSVGPLPEAATEVVLPAVQTYSDGTVAQWNQAAVAGEEEPENPAPSFTTVAMREEVSEAYASTTALTFDDSKDVPARWLAGGGLAAGVVALGLGAVALRRSRRASVPVAPSGTEGGPA